MAVKPQTVSPARGLPFPVSHPFLPFYSDGSEHGQAFLAPGDSQVIVFDETESRDEETPGGISLDAIGLRKTASTRRRPEEAWKQTKLLRVIYRKVLQSQATQLRHVRSI